MTDPKLYITRTPEQVNFRLRHLAEISKSKYRINESRSPAPSLIKRTATGEYNPKKVAAVMQRRAPSQYAVCPMCKLSKSRTGAPKFEKICDCGLVKKKVVKVEKVKNTTVLTFMKGANNICYYHVQQPKDSPASLNRSKEKIYETSTPFQSARDFISHCRSLNRKTKKAIQGTRVTPLLKMDSPYSPAQLEYNMVNLSTEYAHSLPMELDRSLSNCESQEVTRIEQLQIQRVEPSVEVLEEDEDTEREPPTYLVYKGNNSKIISDALARREGWIEGNYEKPTEFTFEWRATSKHIRYDRLLPYLVPQIVNHFEFHAQLSEKDYLFENLKNFWEKSGRDVFQYVPMTFSIELFSPNYHVQLLHFFYYFKSLIPNPESPPTRSGKRKPKPSTITTPDFNFYPLPENHFDGENIWILKPTGFNRGRGIHIFNDLKALETLIAQYKEQFSKRRDSHKKTGPVKNKLSKQKFIIQKYIEKPLLIYERKFDIRMWVLLTHEMDVYMFSEGYIRTSSNSFTLSNLDDDLTHLTNNAVQKYGAEYGKFEEGNQLSFPQFQAYLDEFYPGVDFKERFMPMIKQQVVLSMLSVRRNINKNNRTHSFEIFGYDFIIDLGLDLWLIEVNTNPWLEESSPLLAQLIPRMVDDAFELTIDKLHPYTAKEPLVREKVLELPDTNMWELLKGIK